MKFRLDGEILRDELGCRQATIEEVELFKQRDELLAALGKMNLAYVRLMESGRDRIRDLGGECDGIEAMEQADPYLRESRAVIASVKANTQ